MGSHIHIHVGAYLECHNQEVSEEVCLRFCPNEGCVNYESSVWAKFCPECGSAIEQRTTKTEKALWRDYTDDEIMFHAFTQDRPSNPVDIYISNQRFPGDPKRKTFSKYTEDDVAESITPESLQAELDHFCKTYAEQIEKAKKLYGEERVFVRWGYVAYWM